MKSKAKTKDCKPIVQEQMTSQEIRDKEKLQMDLSGHIGSIHVIMVQRGDNSPEPIGIFEYLKDVPILIKKYLDGLSMNKSNHTAILEQLSKSEFDSLKLKNIFKAGDDLFEFSLVSVPFVVGEYLKNPDIGILMHLIYFNVNEDSEWLFTAGSKQAHDGFSYRSKISAPTRPEGLINLLAASIESVAIQRPMTTDDILSSIRQRLLHMKSTMPPQEKIQ